MRTFQETFEAIPEADKPAIAKGMIYFLIGAASMMEPKERNERNGLESLLFAAMRSAKETHKR